MTSTEDATPLEVVMACGRNTKLEAVLGVVELLDLILDELCEASLASMARTCRSFFLPSISHLWNTVDTSKFYFWLDLLADSEEATEIDSTIRSDFFMWQRWSLYAQFVRTLSLWEDSGEEDVELHLRDAFRKRMDLASRASLSLSRVRSLNHGGSCQQFLYTVMRSLPSLLESVGLWSSVPWRQALIGTADQAELKAFLRKLAKQASLLKKLSLTSTLGTGNEAVQGLVDLLRQSHNLQAFEAAALAFNPSVLHSLLDLPHLRQMTLSFPPQEAAPHSLYDIARFPDSSFSSLRLLDLDAQIVVGNRLLGLLPNVLEQLIFNTRLNAENTPADLEPFANIVGRRQSQLQFLRTTVHGGPWRGDLILPWNTFAGFYQCRSLVHFHFYFASTSPMDLRDADIQCMSQAWPKLRTLRLEWFEMGDRSSLFYGGLLDESALTMDALGSLGLFCPEIESVWLSNFNPVFFSTPGVTEMSRAAPRLALNVGNAPLKDPGEAARYLGSIWSNVTISWSGACPKSSQQSWQAVNDYFVRSTFNERMPLNIRMRL